MLHMLLLILKILGIGLLVLLGLLLLFLLIVLFVPLGYEGQGSFIGKVPRGRGRVRWLWGLISLSVSYDGEASAKLRLFGIPLFDLLGGGEKKERAEKGRGRHKKRRRRKNKKQAGEESGQSRTAPEPEESPEFSPAPEPELSAQDLSGGAEHGTGGEESSRPGKLLDRIQAFFKRLSETARHLIASVKRLLKQKEELTAFLENPDTREAIGFLWRRLKILLGHFLPKKASGRILFGTDDPYMTGKILMYMSWLYPLYGGSFSVEPAFDRAVFEAEGRFKGRLRMIHLAAAAVRILLNKKTRAFLKAFLDK